MAKAAATAVVLLADVIVFSLENGWTERVGIQAKPAAPDMVPDALVDDRWMLIPTSLRAAAEPRHRDFDRSAIGSEVDNSRRWRIASMGD
ncbi:MULTISPECIES: hypothetical protein [unclassified Mesorhizobium]|uniref:hypothetical protein n=1 Tax=unclassified Mesorhizobium TaxID=325217 RepID=UPI001927E61E|nr:MULTISPECIES: hypothetical protein [unclassified Mesorhizobium]